MEKNKYRYKDLKTAVLRFVMMVLVMASAGMGHALVYDSSTKTCTLYSADDWMAFVGKTITDTENGSSVNLWASGITVKLGANINLAGKTLRPVGDNSNGVFLASFDGQGYTISNGVLNADNDSYRGWGLFGYAGTNTMYIKILIFITLLLIFLMPHLAMIFMWAYWLERWGRAAQYTIYQLPTQK